jgi:hypothetical protein
MCIVGPADIALTSFTLANNQATPAIITGLIFNSTIVGLADIIYWIKRVTTGAGATELTEGGKIQATFDVGAGTWRIVQMPVGPDNSGIEFSIDSTSGQVKYTSSNLTGTPSVSKMDFKASTMGV